MVKDATVHPRVLRLNKPLKAAILAYCQITGDHLAAVADTGTNHVTLYVNGEARDQQDKASDIVAGDTTLSFGRWNMDGRFLSGDLDDIAIWERALAVSEIVALSSESPRRRSTP